MFAIQHFFCRFIWICEVIDISHGNLDSSLCFIQPSVSHDVLCINPSIPVWVFRLGLGHWGSCGVIGKRRKKKMFSLLPERRPANEQHCLWHSPIFSDASPIFKREAFFPDVPEIQCLLTILSLPIRELFQELLNAPRLLIFTQNPFFL